MKSVFGDIRSLKASERSALEKLYGRKTHQDEVLSLDLAKKAASLAQQTSSHIGLIIGRDGRVTHVVFGDKDRLYLPDLGRFRLNNVRLRRLRLIVFFPDAERYLTIHKDLSLGGSDKDKKKGVLSPKIAADFLTDLEKLRFDILTVVAVRSDGTPGETSFAYLEPGVKQSSSLLAGTERSISFHHIKSLSEFNFDFLSFISELEKGFNAATVSGFDTSKEQAILVGAYTSPKKVSEASMAELMELARTAGVEVLDSIMQRRKKLDPRTVVGKGKLEEIVLHSLDLGADLLIFDRELSPGQLRNITNLTEIRVLDRSMLILDIFAQRATSREGKLQVELAQLRYSLPRLTETDSGLSRLTGGIGGRGPGETKLEVGRRRVRKRISDLEKRIDKVADQRGLRRERRQSRGVPVIAIVGYTNAGKSTLLNSLTKGEVIVENKLFATLDPSSRRMRFPNDKEVVFVDTVGFIRELPKELVQAFRATLEEVGEANYLMHVVDASSPDLEEQLNVVRETLDSLGYGDKPRLLVLNKCDLLSPLQVDAFLHKYGGLAVSALGRTGFSELMSSLQEGMQNTFTGQDPGRFTEISQW